MVDVDDMLTLAEEIRDLRMKVAIHVLFDRVADKEGMIGKDFAIKFFNGMMPVLHLEPNDELIDFVFRVYAKDDKVDVNSFCLFV